MLPKRSKTLVWTGMIISFAILVVIWPMMHNASSTVRPDTKLSQALVTPSTSMVARMWHGRTLASKADAYTSYINEAGLTKIRKIPGNKGIQMFRRTHSGEAEFYVISYWSSREAIQQFAGEDIEKVRWSTTDRRSSLPRDPEFLLEVEPKVKHFDLLVDDWKR
jgi:heme-degrading monooxygenase HmoA